MPYPCLFALLAAIQPMTAKKVPEPPTTYINSKHITIRAVVDVGPSGLTRATLWATDDARAWKSVNEVGAAAAPPGTLPNKLASIPLQFAFAPDRDGAYQFIVIAETQRGPSRRVPTTGETGELRVVVDTFKPAVEVVSIRVAQGAERKAVVDIQWKATDVNMAPAPIKLEYMSVPTSGNAAWKAITPDWIQHTGKYTWTPPDGEGVDFLVRVTCKDRAGNQAHAGPPKPVNVDLTVPVVRNLQASPGRPQAVPAFPDISVGPAPKVTLGR